MIIADRKGKAYGLENLRPYHRMESMRKSNILSRLLFVLFSPSRIMTYSLLNWPKVYIPHWWAVFWMNLGIIPFSKIFLTLLFDTLTNNVPFLFLFLIKHLFKCVALLCIYIIVVLLLFIYMWDFNSFMYVFSWVTSGSFVSHIDRRKLFLKL
jgi:hypothetical protein